MIARKSTSTTIWGIELLDSGTVGHVLESRTRYYTCVPSLAPTVVVVLAHTAKHPIADAGVPGSSQRDGNHLGLGTRSPSSMLAQEH